MLEFTVFISVKIDNLNELSTSMPEIVSIEDKMNNESININTEIKYLFIGVQENQPFVFRTVQNLETSKKEKSNQM